MVSCVYFDFGIFLPQPLHVDGKLVAMKSAKQTEEDLKNMWKEIQALRGLKHQCHI